MEGKSTSRCWPQAHMEENHHYSTSEGGMCGRNVGRLAVKLIFLTQSPPPVVTSQFPQNARLAPESYTGRNL